MDDLRTRYLSVGGDGELFDQLTKLSSEHLDPDDEAAAAGPIAELLGPDVRAMSESTARFTIMMANYMIAQGVEPDRAEYAAGVVFAAFKFNANQLVDIAGDLRIEAKHIREHHEGGVREGRCDQEPQQSNDQPAEKPNWWGKLFQ